MSAEIASKEPGTRNPKLKGTLEQKEQKEPFEQRELPRSP
jgi:hypothetical protein